ncbi:hypothetical protein [Frankia sp. CcI49]|uniref:hypothetical protein n=1 Tax=Frankia sp. CcI49 TaxID=1745382 RepID=UPI0018E93DA7|nr:hypothetical protein [Frankia sp. CcI49]
MLVVERADAPGVCVEETNEGLALVVRPGVLTARDVRALRAVLACVAGRIVGPPATGGA